MRKLLRNGLIGTVLFLALVLALYLAGPRPAPFDPSLGQQVTVPPLETLEGMIQERESLVKGLKADNEARILWANPENPAQTPFSLVYLHGFGASHAEGRPVHREVAKAFGMNLFLSRLHEHGIERGDAFANLSAASYLASAREALAVGKALGDQVILMGTSTGASLALALAAEDERVAAVIAYAPLIDSADGLLFLPRGPWGKWLVKQVQGDPRVVDREPALAAYWSRTYDAQAYVALSQLIGETMHAETYARVECPFFLGYYYENEARKDDTVSIAAMRNMFSLLGTPPGMKKEMAFPGTKAHVIASDLVSQDWQSVREASIRFLAAVLDREPHVTANSQNDP